MSPSLLTTARAFSRVLVLCLASVLAISPLLAAGQAAAPASTEGAASSKDIIVSSVPTPFEAEGGGAGAYGQLPVAAEVTGTDARPDLVYTITVEPLNGRVGLSGGNDDDIFKNKTSRLGYFAYKPRDDFSGEDSFTYTARNETSGLVFKNTVVIKVTAPPPVMLDKFSVGADRNPPLPTRSVSLTTRPNTPVTQKVPSHDDFMTPADRIGLEPAKIVYMLDDKAKPQNGTAKLDPVTGMLTYAPNPGFVGEERFKYYTADENNKQLGTVNTVTVAVEPTRISKHVVADRSKSREVDLIFVINNSSSMADHQARLAANLSRFRQLFHTRDLDYRIAVLTTDFVNADPTRSRDDQAYYKNVRGTELDAAGNPVLDSRGRPKTVTKRVASNGSPVTLPALPQPWVTPKTPDAVFSELVKVGTNGDSNRTAFTAVYNFVSDSYNKLHSVMRPDAMTIVVFFMDEEETRMATYRHERDGTRRAEWIEDGKLPALLEQYNARNPQKRQTLDSYITTWVLRPFIIAKGNKRGKLEVHAVVSPGNVSHRRAAELTGGIVLNIESDFSAPLAALGDRIADTVAVALDPVDTGATFYQKSLKVKVDGKEMSADAQNGWTYDPLTHSVRFQGAAKKQAFLAKIDITYEEHL